MTLATGVAIGLTTAALLAYAGRVFQRRPVSPEQLRAARAFAGWWYSASVVILLTAIRTGLGMAGITDPRLHTALAQLGNLPLAAALGCLMYYVLFLLTGRSLHWPIVLVYGSYLGYLTWFTVSGGDRELKVGEWQAQLMGGTPPTAAANLLFGLLLAVPVLVTVTAYLILAFRVKEVSQRYRLRLMSAAFVLLFGSITLAYLLRWNERTWFPLAYEIPALVTAALVVGAYRPPRWVQRRLEVLPVSKDVRA